MLTKLTIRNFKRFEEATIDLGKVVVFVGPNNSGKTAALQALALWDVGIRNWKTRREGSESLSKRPGVTINRRDLIAIPVPTATSLWRGLHVRRAKANAKEGTENIRIDVSVSGVTQDVRWECGFEFDFRNEESITCRPLRLPGYEAAQVKQAQFSTIPTEASNVKIAYLPPMSGMAAEEPLLQPGSINILIGEGQTAQVLRNLCYQIHGRDHTSPEWDAIVRSIHKLFNVKLLPPQYVAERGEITMAYQEHGAVLDLSSAGRGLQQTLLLLTHLHANPGTVLLMDEPDAHLEIIRQREILRLITDVAEQTGSQVIAASHSEVILAEAAMRGTVIAFLGKPHVINDRGSQLLKSLTDIGWDQYYQAEENGWVLYLESASDLEILRVFAARLQHKDAIEALSRPFVHYVSTNVPPKCRDHFHGLREAKPDLLGVALFDRIDKELSDKPPLCEMMWKRREIENYFCTEEVLLAYARGNQADDLFGRAEAKRRETTMRDTIREMVQALETLSKPEMKPWSDDIKATDYFLEPIFKKYFEKLKLPIVMRKTGYHELARLMPKAKIPDEVREKLDVIASVAKKAVKPQE